MVPVIQITYIVSFLYTIKIFFRLIGDWISINMLYPLYRESLFYDIGNNRTISIEEYELFLKGLTFQCFSDDFGHLKFRIDLDYISYGTMHINYSKFFQLVGGLDISHYAIS